MRPAALVLAWVVSRSATLWLLIGPESWVTGDVRYYAQSLEALPASGLTATLVEYPLLGVALVAVPWLVSGATGVPEAAVVALLALSTDALFTLALARLGRGRRAAALWVWLAAVPALGATAYARFDLVPGTLVGLAVLLLSTWPRWAAAAGAVATGIKLWPVLVLPALAARPDVRTRVVGVVLGVGAALVVLCVAVAGWSRLVSPLGWQAERGLHAESVLATPAMLVWALAPGGHDVHFSEFNALEVVGPGVGLLLTVSGLLQLALVVALGLLWWRLWRYGGALTADTVGWGCLAAVTGFVVVSKVLSPQYLLWLLPAAAATVAVAESRAGRMGLTRWAWVLVATALATHLVFPTFYVGVSHPLPWSGWVVGLLAMRNALLVVLLGWAYLAAWRGAGDQRRDVTGVASARGSGGLA